MSTALINPKRWLVLLAVMLAFLPVVIDMTILHVAVPTLTQDLRAPNNAVLWIIDIYPLLMAGLVVPMGALADRVGARNVLLAGLTIFGIASLWAAFSASAGMLIAARGLLAAGGAMIMPTVLGIIRKTFEDENERTIALGLWGMVGAAGAAIGPLIGGALLAHFWWGSVFLINVPIMVVVIAACFFLLPSKEETTPGGWPIKQALILIAGMMTIVYGLKAGFGGKHSLSFAFIIMFTGMILLAAFARLQLRSKQPMLDLSLFSSPAIQAGIILSVVASGALAGVELTLAQELQYVLDKTPFEAGVFLIPIMVAAAIGGPLASFLFNRLGLQRVASAALMIAAASLGMLSVMDFHNPGLVIPSLLALLGLTLSIGLTASSVAIMGSVDASKASAGGSLEATAFELGTGLGISVFGVFMSATFSAAIELPPELAQQYIEQATRSIGDVFIVANDLPVPTGDALIEAGKIAFIETHSKLLLTAAAIFAGLAFVVFFLLASNRIQAEVTH